MTPTYREVTEEQYNTGSSARCKTCKTRNYFLVEQIHVSYLWECAECSAQNLHPLAQHARKRLAKAIEKGFRG